MLLTTRTGLRAVVEESLIAVAEGTAIILEGGRRHRWIAEVRMAPDIWRPLFAHITARCFVSIVIATLGHVIDCSGRRALISDRSGMRTSGQRKRR